MSQATDVVQDAELQTSFEAESIVHTYTETGDTAQERAVRREEHWKRLKYIGGGSYGSVWLEQCVKGQRDLGLRAVKEVTKSSQPSKKVDYGRELEAISKFSHRKYERCFVKSFGWYENDNTIFIAMEYFEQGDLQHLLNSLPPLSEGNARQVTFQVLEGLQFMHTNGFAHRDLKPGNILVRSKPPDPWWVKLGDFGISKRAADEVMASSTVKGTLRYMAPELLEFTKTAPGSESSKAQAADMWALGEIAFQMLTKEPTFKSMNLLLLYVRSPESFPTDALRSRKVSQAGIDFIKRVMQPKPKNRLTAAEALEELWITSISGHMGSNLLSISSTSLSSNAISVPPMENPSIEPSGRWSTVSMAAPVSQPKRSISDFFSKRPSIPAATASDPKTITPMTAVKLPERSMSTGATNTVRPSPRAGEPLKVPDKPRHTSSTEQARFFTIKAGSDIAIETSAAHGIWTCGTAGNTRLSNAYKSAKGPIFLIYSVNGSRQFCGVAQMKSVWDRKITTEHWQTVGWEGGFHIEWLSFEPIDFDDVKHLTHREDGVSITLGRFILELNADVGVKMMRKFGVEHLVPALSTSPSSASQPGSSRTLGTLGVSALDLATDTETDTGDISQSWHSLGETESQGQSQTSAWSIGSSGTKRLHDDDEEDQSDNDRKKRA